MRWRKTIGRIASLNRAPGILFAAVLLLAFLTACKPQPAKQFGPPDGRYKLKGEVISVDKTNRELVIKHGDIPGLMAAMTMPYPVKNDKELSAAAKGDLITADVVVQNGEMWLENVQVTQRSTATSGKPAAEIHIPAPGEQAPDFDMVNQSGKHVTLSRYRGKALILTFIYTRCPFADYCPRVNAGFAEIDKEMRADAGLYAKTHLLSISFDPAHDTPRVLREFGLKSVPGGKATWFEHWEFVVPLAAQLPRVANFFGLDYREDGGLITHSLSTAVIGPDGRIFKWYHGSEWKPSDLLKDATDALRSQVQTAGVSAKPAGG